MVDETLTNAMSPSWSLKYDVDPLKRKTQEVMADP